MKSLLFRPLSVIPLHLIYDIGFIHLLSFNFLSQLLSFLSILIIAKIITPLQLGEIKILQSYVSLFITLGGFGISSAVLKFCSENRAFEEKKKLLHASILITSQTSLISFGLLVVLASIKALHFGGDNSKWLFVYGLIIPFTVTTELLTVFMQSIKQIKVMARLSGFIKILTVLLVISSTWLWGFRGFIFSNVISSVFGLVIMFSKIGINLLPLRMDSLPSGFLNFAIFGLLSNGINVLGQSGDILILDLFAIKNSEIGFYSLATVFVLAATQVTNTVQAVAVPYFTERAHDNSWLRRQHNLTQLRVVLLSSVVAGGIYLIAFFLIKFVYGSSYGSTLNYLLILLIRYILLSCCAIIGVTLFALGHIRFNFIASLISTTFGLLLSYCLVIQFGAFGVAWGQVFSALVLLFIMVILVRKVLI